MLLNPTCDPNCAPEAKTTLMLSNLLEALTRFRAVILTVWVYYKKKSLAETWQKLLGVFLHGHTDMLNHQAIRIDLYFPVLMWSVTNMWEGLSTSKAHLRGDAQGIHWGSVMFAFIHLHDRPQSQNRHSPEITLGSMNYLITWIPRIPRPQAYKKQAFTINHIC